ncbi:MAG: SpoIIE family protein phosphatase [Dechloromonas sp.]|nr:SpoIIE family protein phosphatase [Dechloromonas sp.]
MPRQYDTMKVLAVDDNRTNLHILQVFLKKLGHQVILAEDGQQAVDKFQSEQPDLILLDIMMPVMDGFEAARKIKASNTGHWTPIIFLSALNRDENLVEGLEAGADDYLTKPINFVVLEAKLRSMQRSLAMQSAAVNAAERLKTISDNVRDAIITIDRTGCIATVNHATETIFGHPGKDLVGALISQLLPATSGHESCLTEHYRGQADQADRPEHEDLAKRADDHHFPVTVGISEVQLDEQNFHILVVRDISERKQAEISLRDNATLLQNYFDRTQGEQQLALSLMEKQLHRRGLQDPRIKYKVTATENFSGDIVAASRSAEGRFYALLADATGHGLTAAICVLPVLALFYRMTRLNRSIDEMAREMNSQLKESMPIGRFVAATLVCLDEESLHGEIWIGGTPEAVLVDRWGRMSEQFPSDNLPLGIVESTQLTGKPRSFTWTPESQLVLYSDGLLEASNAQNQQFGEAGLRSAIANSSPDQRFSRIEQALHEHLGSTPAADDVSLLIIDCP